MEFYNSKYLHLAFFAEQELIEMTWLSSTNEMTQDEYKQESLKYLSFFLEFCPKNTIADTTNMLFPIVPELQEWTNEIITAPIIEKGLKKVAIIVSKELIAQLSVEQVMEEQEAIKLTTQYFDNKEKAKEWLLSL